MPRALGLILGLLPVAACIEYGVRADLDAPRTALGDAEVSCDAPQDRVLIQTVELPFPSREGCPWNVGDNLGPRNEHNQARVEETHRVSLPAGVQLCDLAIGSDTDALSFDDHITLTLNDIVLVGGGSAYDIDALPHVDDLPRYAWDALQGQPFADRYAPYTCLGDPEVCVVPQTEQVGPLEVSFSDTLVEDIARDRVTDDDLTFSWVTFGDDDAGDCGHSDFTLHVQLAWVAP